MPKTEAPLATDFPPTPLVFQQWLEHHIQVPRSSVFQVLGTPAKDSEAGEHLESLRLSNHTGQIRLCHTQVGKSAHFTGWMI